MWREVLGRFEKQAPASVMARTALDGSACGLAVARFVAKHRDLSGASPSVSPIHVVPDLTKITVPGWIEREVRTGIEPEQVNARQKAAFENAFKPAHGVLTRVGITAVEVRLIGQAPGNLIVAHATKSRLDVLAMGSLGFGAARHTIMGSVATRVAWRSRTALLLVREK